MILAPSMWETPPINGQLHKGTFPIRETFNKWTPHIRETLS